MQSVAPRLQDSLVGMAFVNIALIALVALSAVGAIPTYSPDVEARQSIAVLNSVKISSFKPFTFFASAGYCKPSQTRTWTCGTNCDANPGFEPVASGGDGDETQFCG